jgi:hypothetical protein
MSNAIPEGFLKAIPKIAKPIASAKSTVTLTDEAETELSSGWDKIKTPKNHRTKDVSEWNRKDVVVYFYAKYRDAYHAGNWNIPWRLDYATIEDIMVMLEKQLKVSVGIPILKQYFDWAFDSNYINDLLSRKIGKFGMNDLKKEKPVLLFVQSLGKAAPLPVRKVEDAPKIEPKEMKGFSFDDLVAAHKIHSQFFIQNYGLLIPVNYLITFKGKTEEEAIQYVRKAVEKYVTAKPLANLVKMTKKFEPYPKWLPFLDLKQFAEGELLISDDNEVFEALRRKVN